MVVVRADDCVAKRRRQARGQAAMACDSSERSGRSGGAKHCDEVGTHLGAQSSDG